MKAGTLNEIRDLIQQDIGRRGLAADKKQNLLTECAGDFAASCQSIAETRDASVAIVTGFLIPHAQPPAAETDGPLGAVFLAHALCHLGIKVVLLTDDFCTDALHAGLRHRDLVQEVPVVALPRGNAEWARFYQESWLPFAKGSEEGTGAFCRSGQKSEAHNRRPAPSSKLTHLIAIERPGPSHTESSMRRQYPAQSAMLTQFRREIPPTGHDRYHNMRGDDITNWHAPAHRFFDDIPADLPGVTTVGIGDGGNEIGMGKIPWETIRKNIVGGGRIACRVPTDCMIVSGISNWGAYGLATGISLLLGTKLPARFFSMEHEHQLLKTMVEQGTLVDGVAARAEPTVDGIAFSQYATVLASMGRLTKNPTIQTASTQ